MNLGGVEGGGAYTRLLVQLITINLLYCDIKFLEA